MKLNKRIVIFGAPGFLGTHLVARLVSQGYTNILSVSRNESSAVALKERFPMVELLIGDIADQWTVKKAMLDADEVLLLSAMKHVNLSEKDVHACMQTNVLGTMNIIQESYITKPTSLIFISSDKAAQATGVYGMSKKLGEKLMEEAEAINPWTQYRTVRYGNVIYSSGSVLCKWKDKMLRGEEVIVTDENATRFFWPVSDALDLIFSCIEQAKDAKPFICGMKSMRIGDLLEAMMTKYGRVPVKTIGLQPGENMHEVIIDEMPDSFHSERFTKEEILNLI